uniref:Putative secreted protein n=1 Tax=Anopheles darlingi TaxID=43151 RepID=A0A2M4DLK2_ANODA
MVARARALHFIVVVVVAPTRHTRHCLRVFTAIAIARRTTSAFFVPFTPPFREPQLAAVNCISLAINRIASLSLRRVHPSDRYPDDVTPPNVRPLLPLLLCMFLQMTFNGNTLICCTGPSSSLAERETKTKTIFATNQHSSIN